MNNLLLFKPRRKTSSRVSMKRWTPGRRSYGFKRSVMKAFSKDLKLTRGNWARCRHKDEASGEPRLTAVSNRAGRVWKHLSFATKEHILAGPGSDVAHVTELRKTEPPALQELNQRAGEGASLRSGMKRINPWRFRSPAADTGWFYSEPGGHK